MKWKFRPHRGTLAAAMAEAVEVDGREGLMQHLRSIYDMPIVDSEIVLQPSGDDPRIGWNNVYMVILPEHGVLGYCTVDEL